MSTGHDKKCTNCDGAGERMFFSVKTGESKIVECALCGGTGLVEVDEFWEHG